MQHGGHITKDLLGPRGVPVGEGGPAFGTGAKIYGIYDDPVLGVYDEVYYAL